MTDSLHRCRERLNDPRYPDDAHAIRSVLVDVSFVNCNISATVLGSFHANNTIGQRMSVSLTTEREFVYCFFQVL